MVVVAGVLFGTTGTTRALAPVGASSLSVGSARLAFGGLILGIVGLIVHLWKHRWPGRAGTPVRPKPWRARAHELGVVAICSLAIMAYQITFFEGTRANGVMVGTMVALGSSPLIAGALEWLVLRRRPSLGWLLATGVCVAGVIALSWAPGPMAPVSAVGVLNSLAAGASYAVLVVGAKWLLERGWDPLDSAAAFMGLGALMAWITLAGTDLVWMATPGGVAAVVWLAVGTIAIAYIFNLTGLAHTTAATATTLNLSEPTTATILGMVVLGEQLTWTRLIGIATIAVGVLLLGLAPTPKPAPEPLDLSAPAETSDDPAGGVLVAA